MFSTIRIWIRLRYHDVVNSIAFYPAFIALWFVVLAFAMIWFDLSGFGEGVKEELGWLGMKDANAARTIVSTIAAGIITLTVFSFSMVMIVLNQAASQLSNRVLDQLIGNRFQQFVLGSYIGTIVYSLLLLTTIHEGDTSVSLPALSTYMLILIAVVDIFLFIYFLHYITQSVKYDVIIKHIHGETKEAMDRKCILDVEPSDVAVPDHEFKVFADRSGVYEDFQRRSVLALCVRTDRRMAFPHPPGTFILKGTCLACSDKEIPDDLADELRSMIPLARIGSVDNNFANGFRQLTEVAVKALSPGVNDPGTAMLSLRALFDLYADRSVRFPDPVTKDEEGNVRITERIWTFDNLFEATILPIWDYGKDDRSIQWELQAMLDQLTSDHPSVQRVRNAVRHKYESHRNATWVHPVPVS